MPKFGFVGTSVTKLGESPVWDHRTNRLWWVDSLGKTISGSNVDGSEFCEWNFASAVGSIGLMEGGGLITALADGFYQVNLQTGEATPVTLPESVRAPVRFNDGKADRDGRFLCATMTSGDLTSRNGTLWRLDSNSEAHLIEQDFIIGNALCFSPCGTVLYFADSMEGTIRQYDYDRTNGEISNRRALVDCRPYGSGPDGATVDSEGNVWVALVQAQKVACFNSAGELLQLIDVPVPYPSCVAFGGENLDILFVTAISDSGWTMKADGPAAGRILTISGIGAQGIPETPVRLTHPT